MGTKGNRAQLTNNLRASLRELSRQLSMLNHRVSERMKMKDVDFDCLDLASRHGPMSPSALAREAGLHPATMTGVLDRLERGGWVVRERDPDDRRAVRVRVLTERGAEILRLYGGMNRSIAEICSGYDEKELAVVARFIEELAQAGRRAAENLASSD